VYADVDNSNVFFFFFKNGVGNSNNYKTNNSTTITMPVLMCVSVRQLQHIHRHIQTRCANESKQASE